MEPQTTAKVVLHTTKGPIEIELWAKETPLACRNFIQLCLSGYYNNCKFHRIIKDFIVQSGDPSGSGYGGSAIYESGTFRDEFHSRLKFNKRGIVGSANTGAKDSNGSQFIITLGPTPELNNKNTVFGRIVGDTFYNVLKIAEGEVDDEKPLYPVVIESTEVVVKYFDDLERAEPVKRSEEVAKPIAKRKKAKVKISYGSDEEEDEVPSFKIKSAHELLKDKKLTKVAHSTPEKSKTTTVIPTKRSPSPLPSPPPKSASLKKSKEDREKATLEMLKKFQNKLNSVSTTTATTTTANTVSTADNTWNSDDELPSDYEEEIDDSTGLYNHTFRA